MTGCFLYLDHGQNTPLRPPPRAREPLVAPEGTVSEQVKASVTVLEFVSRYVDLKPVGSGTIGLCPFHDDHHPSWYDFKTAVKELARMVL